MMLDPIPSYSFIGTSVNFLITHPCVSMGKAVYLYTSQKLASPTFRSKQPKVSLKSFVLLLLRLMKIIVIILRVFLTVCNFEDFANSVVTIALLPVHMKCDSLLFFMKYWGPLLVFLTLCGVQIMSWHRDFWCASSGPLANMINQLVSMLDYIIKRKSMNSLKQKKFIMFINLYIFSCHTYTDKTFHRHRAH